VSGTDLAPHDQFSPSFLKLFLDIYVFVDVERHLWREVGSVVLSFCWARGTHDHILLPQFLRLPQLGGPGSYIYYAKEKALPSYTPRRGSWFALYSLGTVSSEKTPPTVLLLLHNTTTGTGWVENAASHGYCTIACVPVAAFTWQLLSHYLGTVVFRESFHSNGYLCWLHNSGLYQTCENIVPIKWRYIYY
jgi:hypothetical protein